MGALGMILNFLSGGVVQRVADYLTTRDKAKLDAMNATEKLAFDDRQNARATAKEIRLATSGFWEMRLITFLIAACFTTHLVLVTLDTCFALGLRIAKFPAPFDDWEGAILLSFFGVQVAGTAVKSVIAAGIVKAKRRLTWGG